MLFFDPVRIPIVLSILLVVSSAFAQEPQSDATNPPTPGTGKYSTVTGLEYENVDGKPVLLDLRIPDGDGPWPVILYLHSGAWVSGDRFGGPAVRQASRGYAVASIDYRLAPAYIWPAQIEDCKSAIRWLRANAARFHLDPERIGVWGTSAGGHLAAVLGTSGGVASLEGSHLGNAQYSSRVKAVVDYYGPTDLLKLDSQKIPCLPLDGNAWWMPPSLLMGCPVQSCKEKTILASPMTYVTPDDPPFLIMQGMLDCLVSWQQSVDLHQALEGGGIDSTLILIPNGDHGGDVFDEQKYQELTSAWLDKHLRGDTGADTTPVRRRSVRRR